MKEAYIRFMAPVDMNTADKLMKILDQKIKDKYEKIHLMISSPGGSVFHGLSIYNFLKGIPVEINTYNFGSVDSIGVIIFCAGKNRYSVPHARFLMHGVRMNFGGPTSLDEKQLEENLKSLKIDQQNIAKVIADTTMKSVEGVERDMNNRTTLNPIEAKEYGLVHEIKSELLPPNADLSVIGENVQTQLQLPFSVPLMPQGQSYTKSKDLDFTTL